MMAAMRCFYLLRAFTVLVLLVAVASAESGHTTLRKLWASHDYSPMPIPEAWRSSTLPATERDLDGFLHFHPRRFSVSEFIQRFGVPDRYFVAADRHQWNFLIYDLPTGTTVGLYVSKPPSDLLGAAVILDAQGKLIRLFK